MYWGFIRVRILFPCPLVPPSLLPLLPRLIPHGPFVAGVVDIDTGILSFQVVISVDSDHVLLLVQFHRICLLFFLLFVCRRNLLLALLLAIHILILLLLCFLVLLLLRRLLLKRLDASFSSCTFSFLRRSSSLALLLALAAMMQVCEGWIVKICVR